MSEDRVVLSSHTELLDDVIAMDDDDDSPELSAPSNLSGLLRSGGVVHSEPTDAPSFSSQVFGSDSADNSPVNTPERETEIPPPAVAAEPTDWDAVNALRVQEEIEREELRSGVPLLITSSEAWNGLLSSTSRSSYSLVSMPSDAPASPPRPPPPAPGLCSCLFASTPITASHRTARDDIVAVKSIALDHSLPLHERIIATMYRHASNLDPASPDVTSTGDHWISFGFQRVDPTTDLRSCGMFGCFQLLWFSETRRALVGEMLRTSQETDRIFPFACVSLNWTAVSLNLLQNDSFFSDFVALVPEEEDEDESKRNLIEAVQLVYESVFFRFFQRWVDEGHNIRSYGDLKRGIELEVQARNGIGRLVQRYRQAMEERERV